jgi:hypothetical protein
MSHELFENIVVSSDVQTGSYVAFRRGDRMTYHLDQLKLQMRGIERLQFLLGVGLPELDASHCRYIN